MSGHPEHGSETGGIEMLQKLLLQIHALVRSMDSYEHYGQGFHFYDQAVMDGMVRERDRLQEALSRLIASWREEHPNRLEAWVRHNIARVKQALEALCSQRGPDPGGSRAWHMSRCQALIQQWTQQQHEDRLTVDLKAYWGLEVEGFSSG